MDARSNKAARGLTIAFSVVVAAGAFCFLGFLIALLLSCEDSTVRHSSFLQNEDFSTGLLDTNLQEDQAELITAWALERGFKRSETFLPSSFSYHSFEREDGLMLSYDFHCFTSFSCYSLNISLTSEDAQQLRRISGVPSIMTPGVSAEEVAQKLGRGTPVSLPGSEFSSDDYLRSASMVYYATDQKERDITVSLMYLFIDGRAQRVGLTFWENEPFPRDIPSHGIPEQRIPPLW
ncbi:MAG: hypothetical protein A2Y63_03960 [Candidatus Riflebacteria bacterium RBG_13_59_9]|nr:MAG: hypothetical protein A2Y63_03960 [Candidatus Riflebacteria bacterium RBG_13_59_9]